MSKLELGKDWYKKVSERIDKAMKEMDMSKQELVEKTGLSADVIEKWLHADFRECDISDVYYISKVLSVNPLYLLMHISEEERKNSER